MTGGKKVTVHYANGSEKIGHVDSSHAAAVVLNTSGVTFHGHLASETIDKDYAFDMPADGWISVEDE